MEKLLTALQLKVMSVYESARTLLARTVLVWQKDQTCIPLYKFKFPIFGEEKVKEEKGHLRLGGGGLALVLACIQREGLAVAGSL